MEIAEAPDVMTMDDSPKSIMKEKAVVLWQKVCAVWLLGTETRLFLPATAVRWYSVQT